MNEIKTALENAARKMLGLPEKDAKCCGAPEECCTEEEKQEGGGGAGVRGE